MHDQRTHNGSGGLARRGSLYAILLVLQKGMPVAARTYIDMHRDRFPEVLSGPERALERLFRRFNAGEDLPLSDVEAVLRLYENETLTWTEMQKLPPLDWLVQDLLPVGGISLLIGHPKAGKSTLARTLAAEVAGYGHGHFLGREVLHTGRVLYCSPDEAPQMTVQHFRGIIPHDAEGLDFAPRADLAQLGKLAEAGRHKLMVVDTLGRLFAGSRFPEGGDYMAWQEHLSAVRQVATDTGCHVCLLHHARKSAGNRALDSLGSQAIAGTADCVISLQVAEEAGRFPRFVWSTNRAGVDLSRQKLTLAGDGWLTVDPLTVKSESERDAKAEVRAMKRDGQSVRDISRATGVPKSTVCDWTQGV